MSGRNAINAERKKSEKSVKQKDVGIYIKKIAERLQAYADKKGFRHDVTFAQGKVLFFLHTQKDGAATMKSVENYLDVSHATVSGIISRLQEKGYVECERSPEDARAKTVRLTEKENASFAEMKKRRSDMEKMLLKNFTAEERAALAAYLERVYLNVREAAGGSALCGGES